LTMVKDEVSESEVREENPLSEMEESLFHVSWINASGEEEEGPLSLLWQLISSYKVDIFEISLTKITEDFLLFINRAGDLKIPLASSFAVMAAKLLYYKSKALLPDPGFEEPDPDDRLPPELIQQLLEYRKFQMASEKIRELAELTQGMFTRDSGYSAEIEENSEWLDVSMMDLIQAYSRILKKYESELDQTSGMELEEEAFSVEDKIEIIRKLLENSVSFHFEDLFENFITMNRSEIIATFLAILELVKSGELIVRQKDIFGPIHIFKKSVSIM